MLIRGEQSAHYGLCLLVSGQRDSIRVKGAEPLRQSRIMEHYATCRDSLPRGTAVPLRQEVFTPSHFDSAACIIPSSVRVQKRAWGGLVLMHDETGDVWSFNDG